MRAFADGFVSLLLPVYLLELGFGTFAIGSIIASTLLGSAVLTFWIGLVAHRYQRRSLLRNACVLMIATGAAFALSTNYWPLFIVAFIGTINPTAGDVSLFLPLEQTVLAQSVSPADRTALFARYSLVGTLFGGMGVLLASLPEWVSHTWSVNRLGATQLMFASYGALGLVALVFYSRLSPGVEAPTATPAALGQSKGIVYRLTMLFALDSFGSGFFVQSMLALWLYQRFDLSLATAGTLFFWTGVLTAFSYLVAVRIANRIGLVNTMVYTHIPSSLCLVAIPFVPSLAGVVVLLLIRSALSQMDVPTRSSYVMAIVTPPERPAAASITSVPRSLASALSPVLAGSMLAATTFGWPLLVAGVVKIAYDLMLLAMFRKVRPPEEQTRRPDT